MKIERFGRFGNQTRLRFGKLEDWTIFESCKLRKLNILKVEKLKFGKFKLKAGKWKDQLDSWICQILAE